MVGQRDLPIGFIVQRDFTGIRNAIKGLQDYDAGHDWLPANAYVLAVYLHVEDRRTEVPVCKLLRVSPSGLLPLQGSAVQAAVQTVTLGPMLVPIAVTGDGRVTAREQLSKLLRLADRPINVAVVKRRTGMEVQGSFQRVGPMTTGGQCGPVLV